MPPGDISEPAASLQCCAPSLQAGLQAVGSTQQAEGDPTSGCFNMGVSSLLGVKTDSSVSPQGPYGCSPLPCTTTRGFSALFGAPRLLAEGPAAQVMEGMLTQQLKRLTQQCEKMLLQHFFLNG